MSVCEITDKVKSGVVLFIQSSKGSGEIFIMNNR